MSKGRLDTSINGKAKDYANTVDGIKRLLKDMCVETHDQKMLLFVCEATGGYEQVLVRQCHAEGIGVHVAHANKVRHFAKSKGVLAKTDRLDAALLSAYGEVMQVEADEVLLSENGEKIRELLKRREQLQLDKQREENRLDKIYPKRFIFRHCRAR